MRTNHHGLADRLGHYTVIPLAIAIQKTRSISIRHRRCITSSTTNKNLPEDLVPYWDYDAPNIPNEPRDASAAACTASALYELDGYLPGNHYKETADKIMESLGSPAYRAKVATKFILMHSVGSIPHGQEIDVPFNYTKYYFLEGLMRKRDLEKK